ncbi:MAG: family 10 glycosylhydrolase [Filimonas sp.]|nr:family 10 glycosylhydrolase [Filimonas sp.]
MKRLPYILLLTFLFLQYAAQSQYSPKYEFRGVWIATVVNIDWPSRKDLSVPEQKAEFIRLLDMHKRNGMNAIVMQVRPSADAFYPSKFEPWSEFLTGQQGVPPSPYYDPLQFMIDETHKRGMEFHAWLNPYRAVFHIGKSSIASNHVTRQHPDWFLTYGDKKYFDPGRPEVIDFVSDVVKDLIERYDIDGVHMDDYFYPYRIPGKEFPDQASYRKYGGRLSKDDWRRANCDSIIKRVHDVVVETKPFIKFGISPFGVWRNKSQDANGSDTRAGQTNYDDLYADILLWLKEGWIDYVVPQLYWEIGHKLCDFETLVKWWAAHSYGKHVYIGQAMTKQGTDAPWRNRREIPQQIEILRKYDNIQGSVFFSSKNFESNPFGWNDSLRLQYYITPSIVPPMPWVDSIRPSQPVITNARDISDKSLTATPIIRIDAEVKSKEEEDIKSFVIYLSNLPTVLGQQPRYIVQPTKGQQLTFDILQYNIPMEWKECYIAVSVISHGNNESPVSMPVQFIKTNKGWMIPR